MFKHKQRRLVDNQFIGLKRDLPLTYVEGASYISVDTEEFFIYNDQELPVLVGSGSISNPANIRQFAGFTDIGAAEANNPTEDEIEIWNDSLPTPFTDTIIYYTGTDNSTDPTVAAFHTDANASITAIGGDGGGVSYEDIFGGNAIISGGVIHVTGLQYYVWATAYIINSVYYDNPVSGFVTLDTADVTNSRIDVFVINNPGAIIGTVGVVKGDADVSPVKPSIDLITQVEVSFKIVAANETSPSDIITDEIYNENLGDPSEWDVFSGSGDPAYSIDPYIGSLNYRNSIPDTFSFRKGSVASTVKDSKLIMAVKHSNGITFSRSRGITIILSDSTNSSSDAFAGYVSINNINQDRFNFDFYNYTDWQILSIDFTEFDKIPVNYDTLTIRTTGTPEMRFDWIRIQSGLPTTGTGIYVEEVIAGTGISVDSTDPRRPIVSSTSFPTGLEQLNEGNGIGWRLKDRVAANFGNLGLNAVDFSVSNSASVSNGSTAEGAITFGVNNQGNMPYSLVFGATQNTENVGISGSNMLGGSINTIYGDIFGSTIIGQENIIGVNGAPSGSSVFRNSMVFGRENSVIAGQGSGYVGIGLTGGAAGCFTVGEANVDITQSVATNNTNSYRAENPRFIVGVGDYNVASNSYGSKRNGFTVISTGDCFFPSLTNVMIDAASGDSAVTKQWVQSEVIKTNGYTVATLPAGTIGDRAYVTDATAPAFLATAVGGGSVFTPVTFDGTNWICG